MRTAAFLLAASYCLGQSPLGQARLGRVEGRVLSETDDQPVPYAIISFHHSSMRAGPLLVSADASGRFAVGRLTPGAYHLFARAPGMVEGSFSSSQLGVAPGAAISGILLRLAPQGVLTGRVLDEAKRPVPGLRVVASPPSSASGGVAEAETDDQGHYVITGLRAGAYSVMAALPDAISRPLNSESPSLASQSGLAAATYYPSSINREGAELARVQTGAVTPGIDIVVRSSALVSISGRLGASLPPSRYTYVSLRSLQSASLAFGVTPAADGAFSFTALPRGDYWLQTGNDQGELGPGLLVSVADQNIANLVLSGPALHSLPGRIVNEGSRIDLTRIQVVLEPMMLEYRGNNPQAPLNAEGAFTLSVRPGLYQLNVFGDGAPDHYIKAATLNGRDVLRSGIVADRSLAGELAITFASDGGRLEGVVELQAGSPREVAVLLWPTGSRRHESHRRMRANVDPSGRFELRGVPPGDYFIAALSPAVFPPSNLNRTSWYQVFEDRALRLQVNANGQQTVSLKPFDPR